MLRIAAYVKEDVAIAFLEFEQDGFPIQQLHRVVKTLEVGVEKKQVSATGPLDEFAQMPAKPNAHDEAVEAMPVGPSNGKLDLGLVLHALVHGIKETRRMVIHRLRQGGGNRKPIRVLPILGQLTSREAFNVAVVERRAREDHVRLAVFAEHKFRTGFVIGDGLINRRVFLFEHFQVAYAQCGALPGVLRSQPPFVGHGLGGFFRHVIDVGHDIGFHHGGVLVEMMPGVGFTLCGVNTIQIKIA